MDKLFNTPEVKQAYEDERERMRKTFEAQDAKRLRDEETRRKHRKAQEEVRAELIALPGWLHPRSKGRRFQNDKYPRFSRGSV
jgi:hypothetical protein